MIHESSSSSSLLFIFGNLVGFLDVLLSVWTMDRDAHPPPGLRRTLQAHFADLGGSNMFAIGNYKFEIFCFDTSQNMT